MSSILGKAWLPVIAALIAVSLFAVGGNASSVYADVDEVDIVDLDNDELYDDEGEGDCDDASMEDIDVDEEYDAPVGSIVPICIQVDDWDTVNIQATAGVFVDAYCGDEDDDDTSFEWVEDDDICADYDGQGTDNLTVYCSAGFDSECGDGVLIFFECTDDAKEVDIVITHDGDEFEFVIECQAEPDTVTVTASPTTVEIVPAVGSSAHSKITILISGDGLPVSEDTEVDLIASKCAIEIGAGNPDSSPLVDSTDDTGEDNVSDVTSGPNDDKASQLIAWFHADWNSCTPGDATVTVTVEVENGADIVKTVTIKVVGPPAFITASAAPTSLICGEKSTITVKVTDAIGQNVSDNTPVELISNWGSVIAGTGATLGFPGTGPVNPLASSAAATYNGVAVAYLLTSNNHVGPYEVVVAAGGTVGFYSPWEPGGENLSDPYWNDYGSNGLDRHDYNATNALLYSGAPITTQVTVTCHLPAAPVAPTVAAPSTGTGSITPPNTGDGGLASSSSNAMLLVLVGAAAFVLAGIASVSYARR